MSIEKDLKQYKEQFKKEALTSDEKRAIRLNIISYMHKNPLEDAHVYSGMGGFLGLFSSKTPLLKYASVLVLVVAILGSSFGVSYAAHKSLPGEFLYPVKTSINEKVLSWTAQSPKEKADFYIKLAQTRLQEVEKAATKGKLHAKAKTQAENSFTVAVGNAENYMGVVGKENALARAQLQGSLESVLNAHEVVLDALAAKNSGPEVAEFTETIRAKKKLISQERRKIQAELFAKGDMNSLKINAESQLKEAKKALEKANIVLKNKKPSLSAGTYITAQENMGAAANIVSQGEGHLEDAKYSQALELLQKGKQTADEVDMNVTSAAQLQLDMQLPKVQSYTNSETEINIDTIK